MSRGGIDVIAIIINIVFILLFILIIRSISQTHTNTGISGKSYSFSYPAEDTAFGGVFYRPQFDPSLPYYRYKHIEDSVRRITEKIKLNNRSTGSGMFFGAIGIVSIQDEPFTGIDFTNDPVMKKMLDSSFLLKQRLADAQQTNDPTFNRKILDETDRRADLRSSELARQLEKKKTRHYLALNGYDKENNLTEFFLDKGTNNIAFFVVDSARNGLYGSGKQGHFERRRIAVRYAADDKRVLVPLTEQQYRTISIVFYMAVCVALSLLIFTLFVLPVQIVISISQGKAFTLQNIRRFRMIAVVLLIASLVALTMPYLFRFFFRSVIPGEFVLKSFWEDFSRQLPWILLAPGVFFIGKAFEKGYKLQQENTLTI